MTYWTELKVSLSKAIGLAHDTLHVLLGIIFFASFAFLFRHHRHHLLLALFGVALLQFVNEAFDAVQWILWTQSIGWQEALHDTVITLMLPTIFVLWSSAARTIDSSH